MNDLKHQILYLEFDGTIRMFYVKILYNFTNFLIYKCNSSILFSANIRLINLLG